MLRRPSKSTPVVGTIPVRSFPRKSRFEASVMYLSELLSFFFLLTIFFLLSFSRPPRGMSKQKNSFTLFELELYGAGSGIRTHEGVTPNGCHVNRRISRWDLEAVALTTQPSRRNNRLRLNES